RGPQKVESSFAAPPGAVDYPPQSPSSPSRSTPRLAANSNSTSPEITSIHWATTGVIRLLKTLAPNPTSQNHRSEATTAPTATGTRAPAPRTAAAAPI